MMGILPRIIVSCRCLLRFQIYVDVDVLPDNSVPYTSITYMYVPVDRRQLTLSGYEKKINVGSKI